MKRLAVALILIALFTATTFADVQDFGKFTLDVADGWTGVKNGPVAVITKDDNSIQLSIALDKTNGSSLEEIVASWIAEFEKQDYYESITTPEIDSDGDYSFKAIAPNGANVQAMFTGDENEYLAILMTAPMTL